MDNAGLIGFAIIGGGAMLAIIIAIFSNGLDLGSDDKEDDATLRRRWLRNKGE